ncbi:MAG: hypothetical protein ACKV19_13225 [Verrucomicrobiales bacterium]
MNALRIVIPFSIACGLVAAWRTATAELTYQSHWIGHAMLEPPHTATATALAVTHDGNCLLAGTSISGTPGASEISQGVETGSHYSLQGLGWGGGTAVAASDSHVYLAVTLTGVSGPPMTASHDMPASPAPGTTWHGVYCFSRDGTPAAVPGGRGPSAALRVIHESATNTSPDACAVAGLWRHDDELFLSDRAANRVRVLDAATLAEKRVFRATQPGPLCVLDGELQVVERAAVVTAYSLDGRATGQVLDEGPDYLPGAIAPTPEGRLLVADRGATHQVHLFNMSGVPTRVRTLGDEGGMLGPPAPGEVGHRRLANLVGVGVDAAGNILVAMSPPPTGRVLRAFAPDRKSIRWQVASIAITDGADFDPLGDGLDVYSLAGRHALDLTKPPGQSWRWVAQTVDPWAHPDDPRLGHPISLSPDSSAAAAGSPLPVPPDAPALAHPPPGGAITFLEIEGKRFLIHRTGDGWSLAVWRLQGHIAVPGLVIHGAEEPPSSFALPGQRARGPWEWRDTDGNGRAARGEHFPVSGGRFATSAVDAAAGIWRIAEDRTILYWPRHGFDAHGILQYNLTRARGGRAPSGWANLVDLHYDSPQQSLYVAGQTDAADPKRPSTMAIARLDAWSSIPPTSRWVTPIQSKNPPVLHSAGHLVFALDPATAVVHVLDADRGAVLGTLDPPASSASIPPANPARALRSLRRQDGSYLVLIQDPTFPRALVYHVDAKSVQ